MNEPEYKFAGLTFLIQYRRKDTGVRWHNMASFDGELAAMRYFQQQDRDNACPWEYRMVDIENGTMTAQTRTDTSEEPGK